MTYAAIAPVFGLAAATIALDKGRNSRAWFWAGTLGGPLGLMVVLLADKPGSLPT